MKKIALILLFVSISVFGISQDLSLRFGFHFTGTSSWLMNKQVFDDGEGQDVDANSFGRYFGPTVTFKFKVNLGVELGLNFNKINQKYEGNIIYFTSDENAEDKFYHYNSKISYRSVDIPLLFQVGNKVYFEIGPILHIRGKVSYTRTFDNLETVGASIGSYDTGQGSTNHAFTAYECKSVDEIEVLTRDMSGVNYELWNKIGVGVAIGVGGNIELPKNFIINLGFRANYILTDMRGVNGLNFAPMDYSNINEVKKFKNNPLYAGIRIGLIYNLPL